MAMTANKIGVICIVATVLALPVAKSPARAGDGTTQEAKYASCMALARAEPEKGLERARAWVAESGGAAARHCVAIALVGIERYEEGAGLLEELAATFSDGDPSLHAEILGQAGQVWLLAGDANRARAAQTQALGIDPNDVELLIDRSLSLATMGEYKKALVDLNRAAEMAPNRADVLVYRASAFRHLGEIQRAFDDIAEALALAPAHPEGLLERGILRHHAGDGIGARSDWRRLVEVAPDTPAGAAARANLRRLDVE